MNSGVLVLMKESRMNNKSYNWMKGYYKFQLFKEIVIPVIERNQKNNETYESTTGTTSVNYDIYD